MRGWGLISDSEGNLTQYRAMMSNGTSTFRVKPYIYNGSEWRLCGATNEILVPLKDKDGKFMIDADGAQIFVRNK